MASIFNYKELKKTTIALVQISLRRFRTSAKIIITNQYFLILVLIVVNIFLGAYIVSDYGESWDEANNKIYAEQSLKAYSFWVNKDIALDDYLGPTDQRYRGPAYPMIASLFVSLMQAINNDWFSIDLWHFASFLSFQAGMLFFYTICLRYMHIWAAFGATLLLVTQPLLWGHAFINSKDIPLMVCFLGSIAFGLKMVDAFLAVEAHKSVTEIKNLGSSKNLRWLVIQDWRTAKGLHQKAFAILTGVLCAVLIISKFIQNMLIEIITIGYLAHPNSFWGKLFSRLAINADIVPLEAYLKKGMILYERAVMFVIVVFFVFILFLSLRLFRRTQIAIRQRLRLGWSTYFSTLIYLLAAAVMLGLAVSTRVAGGLAGVLIAVHFLVRARSKSIPALIVFVSIAIFVTYITWPYLWSNPVGHLIESLNVSSEFGWTGSVLFQGVEYKSYDLPANFLPVLLSLQCTEPIFFLFWLGVLLVIQKTFKRTINQEVILIVLVWFLLPFLLVIIFTPLMYDNFRHWLFIVPSIFFLAGFALDALFKRLRFKVLNLVILLVLFSPGLYWDINLHPYQYIYYNSFIGGVKGAFRHFELDYWVTSYREATLYLNEEAPIDSQVLVVGPRRIFMSYAREDLNREWFTVDQLEETTDPVYVIISTRYNYDLTQYPDAKVVHRISRGGADLAVVKQLK